MLSKAEILANRRTFVAALRSSDYSQAQRHLRSSVDPNRFCCLGVACEVFRKETGIGEWVKDEFGRFMFVSGDPHPSSYVMTDSVAAWLGHGDEWVEYYPNPWISIPDYELVSMTGANDNYGKTFAEIADAYEARYITPFEENNDATE